MLVTMQKILRGGCPSKAIIGIVTLLLLGIAGTSITANAAITTTTTPTTSEQYQLYDQKTRDQQVSVNKVWDDGLTNDTRVLSSNSSLPYENYLSLTIQTGVPQTTLRTYAITYDANGGTYGTDNDGNAITTNTITYNAKNQPINGTPATPERTDGYSLIGWSTDKNATSPDPNITLTNTVTDKWMNEQTDGSTITLYPVWQDLHINYAVMAYGIGIDKDASGNTMGITFGPALGYPEFSPYNGSLYEDKLSTQTFAKSHSVSGNATVMNENAPACMDDTHSVIVGTDAGTDAAGNAYRCLHYDNWATIIYWNHRDPYVYDKCIPNHCSKTVTITPNAGTIANRTFSTHMSNPNYGGDEPHSNRGLVGDGQSYIVSSQWDKTNRNVDITQAHHGYAASLVRAKLVGADYHTMLDDRYAGTDAMIRYTSESCILACFPRNLRDAIGAKALSGVSAANSECDEVSNDGVADKLWLFSYGEMTNTVYPQVGFKSNGDYDAKRSSFFSIIGYWLADQWLRSPRYYGMARAVSDDGCCYTDGSAGVGFNFAVAPGFTLP